MPIAAAPVDEVLRLAAPAPDALTLLPTRATLLEQLAERTPASGEVPAALVLIGLLHRDTGWPMPGSQLERVAGALAADVRSDDWLARSGPTEFAVLLGSESADAEAVADRLLEVVARLGVPGLSACAGIAGLTPDTSPSEVHRRATLCITTARAVGAGRVIRYGGAHR